MDIGSKPVPRKKPDVPVKPNTTRLGLKGRFEKKHIGTDTGPVSAYAGTRNTENTIMPVVPSPVRTRPVPAPRKPTPNSGAMHASDQTGQASALVREDQSESDSDFDDTVVYERLGDVIPRWLHLTVDRNQAEHILMERGKNGSFLVRPQQSSRGSGEFAISLKWDGGVKHITIDRVGDFYRFPGYPSFATLVELIQFHTEQDDQLQVMNTFVVLKEPISSCGLPQNCSEKDDQQPTASSVTPSPSQSSLEKSFRPLPRPPDDTWSGDATPRRPLPPLPVQDSRHIYENISYQFSKVNKPPPLPARNSGNRKQSPNDNPLQSPSEADSLSIVVEASESTETSYIEPPYLTVQPEVIWTSEQSGVLNIPGDIPFYQVMSYKASTSGCEPFGMEESEYEYISQLQRQKPRPPLALSGSGANSLHGLWSDNVRGSSIEELDSKGKTLQESLFEILTSEASYLNSLNVFVTMFLDNVNPLTTAWCQLRKHEYNILASNILAVRKISSRFMMMIESEWTRCKPFLSAKAVCELVTDHAQRYFEEYEKYVANHKFQRRQYDELKKTNKNFSLMADELQQHSQFRNISMVSFLSLPYQRITRMPLLVEAVAKRVQIGDDGYQEVQHCLAVLKKVVVECNEKVRQFDNIEALTELNSKIDFGDHKLALVSSTRFIVRTGDLLHFPTKQSKWARKKKETLTLILLNDMLLITRKKGEQFILLDQAQKKAIYTEIIGEIRQPVSNDPKAAKDKDTFAFKIVLSNGTKTRDYKFASPTAIGRMKWTYALHPNTIPKSEVVACRDSLIPDEEELYANLNRKQVEIIEQHDATDADMLTLKVGDVLIVYQELGGWMDGERISDGQRGWFPAEKSKEIDEPRDCIANMRDQQRRLQQSIDAMEQMFILKK